MALAECLLYEGRSLESARGPQSFRTIPSRQLLTGEPCAGEPHARFGRGGEAFPTPIKDKLTGRGLWEGACSR